MTLLLAGLSLLFLWGCGQSDGELETDPTEDLLAEESTPTAEADQEMEEDEPTPTPTNEPTETPTPIPVELNIEFESPLFISDGLTVADISSPEDGWLVVWPDNGGEMEPDDALAFIEIDAGQDSLVKIPIDGADLEANAVQVAMHGGRDSDDEFAADGQNLLQVERIEIETPATQPMLDVSTSVVSDAGYLRVDSVRSKGDGWIAVYDGTKEHLLGFKAIPAGLSEDVDVFIQWHNATTDLNVYLLSDLGNAREFEDGTDRPMEAAGEIVTAEISVGLPAEIVIFDQPMETSALIGRVTSPVDGYVAAFGDSDGDGFPNTIIGSAPITKGLTEYLAVPLDSGIVTTQTIFSIYTDSDGDGAFDYFEDEPVLFADGENEPAPLFVSARSDVEGLLVIDHTSGADLVKVDWVASPFDAWIAVEKLQEGEDPIVVGQAKTGIGLFYDLEIPLSGTSPGDLVRVLLYVNNPDPDLFEPERNDFPLLADGRLVFVEFNLK